MYSWNHKAGSLSPQRGTAGAASLVASLAASRTAWRLASGIAAPSRTAAPLRIASRPAARISSIGVVDAMLAIMMIPARAAARAVARSPSGCASRWNAVGAMMTGIDAREPSSVRSTACRLLQGRNTRGTSASEPNASSFAFNVTSSSAPPAKKS
jgi:hypothetical protein